MPVALIALCLPLLAASDPAPSPSPTPVDVTRPGFEKLHRSGEFVDSDYQYPYLISQTAYALAVPAAELEQKVREFLKSFALPFKGRFTKSGTPVAKLSKDNLGLPSLAVTGRNLEQVHACTATKCGVKLTEKEAAAVQAAPKTAKLEVYEQSIADRVREFVQEARLRGFDERADNSGVLAKMETILPFMAQRYPVAAKFIGVDLEKRAPAPSNLLDSFLRATMVVIGSERLQPILRVGEVFEFREGGSLLFVEVPIYTDHYLDASLRVYEVFPLGPKSVIALTDVMELDELKKSALIRALYKGKMEDAVAEAEADELKRFR